MAEWASSPIVSVVAFLVGAIFIIGAIKTRLRGMVIPALWFVCYSSSDAIATGLKQVVSLPEFVSAYYIMAASSVLFILASIKWHHRHTPKVFLALLLVNVFVVILVYSLKQDYQWASGIYELHWDKVQVAYFLITLTLEVTLLALGAICAYRDYHSSTVAGNSFRA